MSDSSATGAGSGSIVRCLPASVFGLFALIAAAVVVRAAGIGSGELSRDEANSWYVAGHSAGQIVSIAAHETFPPLYPMLLKAWTGLFGDSEAALRSLSMVTGLGTVAATWVWARLASGRLAALFAAALVAFSPAMVTADRLARMYSLETMLATWAWALACLLVLRAEAWSPGRRLAVAAALAVVVAGEVWTSALGIPTAGLQLGLVVLAAGWLRTRQSAIAAGAVAIGLASILPWLPNLLTAASNGASFWASRPELADMRETFDYWLRGNLFGLDLIVRAALAAIVLAALLDSRSLLSSPGDRRRSLLAIAVLLALALVPLVWIYSQFRAIYDSRYLGAAVPAAALAVGALAHRCVVSIRRLAPVRQGILVRAGSLVPAIALLGVVTCAGLNVTLQGTPQNVNPGSEMAGRLRELVRPGDVVIALNAQTYFPLRYYFDESEARGGPVMPLFDWHRSNAAFFTGWADIDAGPRLEPAEVEKVGWKEALDLQPGATFWLATLVQPDYEFGLFAPIQNGQMLETDRISISGPEGGGQIRHAVLAAP